MRRRLGTRQLRRHGVAVQRPSDLWRCRQHLAQLTCCATLAAQMSSAKEQLAKEREKAAKELQAELSTAGALHAAEVAAIRTEASRERQAQADLVTALREELGAQRVRACVHCLRARVPGDDCS